MPLVLAFLEYPAGKQMCLKLTTIVYHCEAPLYSLCPSALLIFAIISISKCVNFLKSYFIMLEDENFQNIRLQVILYTLRLNQIHNRSSSDIA